MYGNSPYISSGRFDFLQSGRRRIDLPPRLFFSGLSKSQTRTTTVLVDGLDAGGFPI